MIQIKIGAVEKSVDDADEQWINQEINRRRREGESVCVRVRIQEGDLDMALSTPTCAGGTGYGRPPNRHEQEMFDVWRKLGLYSENFTGGQIVAFLKQVAR